MLSDDYSPEFVINNETGIDNSLTVAYHRKFHHGNTKKQPTSSAGLFVFVTDVMSSFRWQLRSFPLFLLGAVKSVLSVLTVNYCFFAECD